MTKAEQYRELAADLLTRVHRESDQLVRAEWSHLAASYLRLAELAERNSQADLVQEAPAAVPQQQGAQQQQQPQPKPDQE